MTRKGVLDSDPLAIPRVEIAIEQQERSRADNKSHNEHEKLTNHQPEVILPPDLAPITIDAAPTPEPEPVAIEEPEISATNPTRHRLPSDRQAISHRFIIDGQEGEIVVSLYEDGRAGELFMRLIRGDAATNGLLAALSATASLGLQYGVPITSIARELAGTHFAPSGETAHADIRSASSVTDYLAAWLDRRFGTDKPTGVNADQLALDSQSIDRKKL